MIVADSLAKFRVENLLEGDHVFVFCRTEKNVYFTVTFGYIEPPTYEQARRTSNIRNMNMTGYVSCGLSVMKTYNSAHITAIREHNQRDQSKIENHCLHLGAHVQVADLRTITFV